MSGQMTLFDLVPEEEKQDYEIRLPQLEEYSKEIKLGLKRGAWHLSDGTSAGGI